jgi:polysaccharide export outer membrane protein
MRFYTIGFICLIITLFFSACSNKQYQSFFEKRAALSDTSTQKNAVTLDTYLIQSQDVLQIRNLQNINYIVDQVPVRELPVVRDKRIKWRKMDSSHCRL